MAKSKTFTAALIVASTAAWLYYFIVQKLPLSADETFFAHMFWLLRQGQRQYVDFYSHHLPTYFQMLTPFLPAGNDLAFIWWLRGFSLIVLAAYAAMVRSALWPFLIMFAVFGRTVEIRPDTVGMLIFNFAWLLLLRSRSNAVIAATLGAVAMLFAARAAVMMVPLALLCLWYTRKRPWTLICAGCLFLAMLVAIYISAPEWALIVVRSVYTDPLGFDSLSFGAVPMHTRIFQPERLVLIAMITAALIAAAMKLGKNWDDQAFIILVATTSQIGLIIVDPLPYEYAYAWAMVPTLIGLPGSNRVLAISAMAFATMIAAAAALYPTIKGRDPHPGSFLHLSIERSMRVNEMSTPMLAESLLERHALWNQIAVRSELCQRLQGRVLSYFWYQPICKHDALYDWIGLSWPRGFEKLRDDPPSLIVWGDGGRRPEELLDGYNVYDGFALRRDR